ncbi:MAG TPA: glycoside hydrolase family 2 protein [Acetivibrio saccincola]|uniref:beta-mannosidase n=1 Tax=Acetivibrio saccincola TaxID=1677857 RepID=UPI002BC98082|nr:glycoside hydrolase family 2 protein [Acetivibrio saccincola]HOA97007.1 glycoside hydrolase family 2 protein [Acetivibrio saccincola]HQD29668.1 glycoside hydrolase family 2 protein [Acetivibrio saccincola]
MNMILNLNGIWKMKCTDENNWYKANVPGTVFNDLLNNGVIDDPFYRDNEIKALEIAAKDYEYKREFYIDKELLNHKRLVLCCKGLDTLAEIRINDKPVGRTKNMHRTYEFDIKEYVHEGENTIHIIFESSLEYVRKKNEENPLWGAEDAVKGFPHIRKGHCTFGWDWGPQIPDLGIWRDIFIRGYSFGKLDDVYITQKHEEGKVGLLIKADIENFCGELLDLEVTVTSPDGEVIASKTKTKDNKNHIYLDIENPKLWWPNGYGEQPLYTVEVKLKNKDVELDSKKFRIGLRTIKINRQRDEWGESFEFVVNGKDIFAMGANYIPEDSILARCSRERTEYLIKSCVEANFNTIRVWGGGIYPEDYFFDLCDEYGLIVWQDFMFACAIYEVTDEFIENVEEEAIDNIKRIRHHACLGLWCGNNEIESGWFYWDFERKARHKTGYIKLFEIVLPELVKKYDPNNFYWPSSPSSGGGFENPDDENTGDVHYWDVWHGLKPFTYYRNFKFRFVSEFGFQSFPSEKTIESFTLPEDRNIFSYVMERHQKNGAANGKILYYLSETFKYPKDFSSLIYVSQLLQAEAIKYGVEHWRRNRGRCMGAIYWQLNDCWPVASWSSIDYYGRWKALHYFARKFFAPVLLSVNDEGTQVEFHVTNETMENVKGSVVWKLRNVKEEILKEGKVSFEIAPLMAKKLKTLDFKDVLSSYNDKMETYLEYRLYTEKGIESEGTLLFVKPKHFLLKDPEIKAEITEKEDRYLISLTSKALAKYVELNIEGEDIIFMDNYFDLVPGNEKVIEIEKDIFTSVKDIESLKDNLKIRSLFDTVEQM